MSAEKKKRLKEYQKNYREAKKSKYNNKKQFFNFNLVVIIIVFN